MKHFLLCTFVLIRFLALSSSADTLKLKEYTNAVVEYDHVRIKIVSEDKLILEREVFVKVLNRKGDWFGKFLEYESEFQTLTPFFYGEVLDANKEVLRKITYPDLSNNSLTGSYTLFSDSRLLYFEPQVNNYPYYVKYKYSVIKNGLLNIPDWRPQGDYNLAVKNASLTIKTDKPDIIKCKLFNIDSAIIEKDNKDYKLKWKVSNLNALYEEPMSLPIHHFAPTVMIAPINFEIDGYPGKMDTWENFSKWNYSLIYNKLSLEPTEMKEIDTLIASSNDQLELVEKIYKYMQNRTRYVSIQLGIGGWQPFEAMDVHKNGYGDCKALVNYMKALLNYAGIQSNYCIVQAGKSTKKIESDFPSNQFNHVILNVPMKNDTIWLECTSQFQPFGFLGSFTDNRNVLEIKSEGGKLLATPHYKKDNNTQIRTIHSTLNEQGDLTADIETEFRGMQYDNISHLLPKNQKDRLDEYYEDLPVNNFVIKNVSLQEGNDGFIPTISEKMQISITNYASTSRKRIFIPLNLLNKRTYTLEKDTNRVSPIKLSYDYYDKDSAVFQLPDGYIVEYLPENINIENEFGFYNARFEFNDTAVYYTREIGMNEGIYQKELYEVIYNFYNDIVKYDKAKCVITKTDI